MTIREYRPSGVTGGAIVGGTSALSDNPEMSATAAPSFDATYAQVSGAQSATATFASLPESSATRFRLWFASTVVSETADAARVRFTLKNAAAATLYASTYTLSSSVDRELNAFSFVNLTDASTLLGQPLTLEITDVTPDGGATYRILEVWLQVDGEVTGCAKLPVQWVDYHLEDGTGDPAALNDSDPSGSVTFPPAATLDIGFGGDLTSYPIAGFDLEIEVSGTGRLRWWLEFDDASSSDYILFDHIVDLAGPITIQVRLAADLAAHVDDFLVGAPWQAVVDAMVARIADDAGFTTAAFGQLIAHPANTGDLTITRAQLIAVTAGCLIGRLRRRPLRQFPRDDGLGMSSARRVDANRSMQASLRRGGGVYF